jgi:hypothetical protein
MIIPLLILHNSIIMMMGWGLHVESDEGGKYVPILIYVSYLHGNLLKGRKDGEESL